MNFLRNTWYVAAWDSEVGADDLFPRTLLNEPVLLFRNGAGDIRALRDQCPHRFVPLHMGRKCGEVIQCGYHGLEFDQNGVCVRNPHGEGRIPPAARVKTYPVAERHSLIWIWMGEPEQANPDLIPDFSFMDRDQFEIGQGYLHAKANYLLEVDNIMDLSHIEFLHPTTLGSPGVSAGDPVTVREGDSLWSKRFITNHILSDFLYMANGIENGTPVDRWIDVRWTAPANMKLNVGVTRIGGSREEGEVNDQCHLFTPETDETTHYWYGIGFPKSLGQRAVDMAKLRINGVRKPFETEDLPMVEAQQRRMGKTDFWDMKPVLLASDAAGIQARRLLAQMIDKERAARQAAE
jgi:phenylpropionate dioxygenase-like ring-hydroxylating dioxygenase large terminal subunit